MNGSRVAGRLVSYRLVDAARLSAIVAVVGLLYSPTVGSIGLIAAYAAFLASGEALGRMKQAVLSPPVYWGLAFLGVVILGVTYGSASWQERWTDVLKWRTVLWFIVLFALFDDDRWKMRLLLAFLVGTGLGLAGSFAGVVGGVKLWKPPTDLLRNYVTQSMSFSVSALICLWMLLAGRCKGREQWGAIIAAGLFAANVFFVTHSRSGYAVFILGLIVLLIRHTSPKQLIVAAVVLPVSMGLVLFLSPAMQERLGKGLNEWEHAEESTELTSMGLRKVFYIHTIEIMAGHPVLGVGTGGFKKAYEEQIAGKYSPSDWRSVITGDPHNQYFAIIVQHGLVGLVVFIAWLVAVIRSQGGMPAYRGLALAVLCGWCATSLFSSHFRTFAEGHLVTTFLGVLLAGNVAKHRGEGVSAPDSLSTGGT